MVAEVRGKRLVSILVVIAALAGVAIGYSLHNSARPTLAEISKQTPEVQNYLKQHPNAEYEVARLYLTANGMVYAADENWKLKELRGGGENPIDGKNHYCWIVHWHDPTSMIEHIVDVYIDRDYLAIVHVTEAW